MTGAQNGNASLRPDKSRTVSRAPLFCAGSDVEMEMRPTSEAAELWPGEGKLGRQRKWSERPEVEGRLAASLVASRLWATLLALFPSRERSALDATRAAIVEKHARVDSPDEAPAGLFASPRSFDRSGLRAPRADAQRSLILPESARFMIHVHSVPSPASRSGLNVRSR